MFTRILSASLAALALTAPSSRSPFCDKSSKVAIVDFLRGFDAAGIAGRQQVSVDQ